MRVMTQTEELQRNAPPAVAETSARRQVADTVAEVIAEASRLWELKAGDLIFNGTPEGVGPIARGERVEGRVADLPPVAFTVV